jgi:hypothetical protein
LDDAYYWQSPCLGSNIKVRFTLGEPILGLDNANLRRLIMSITLFFGAFTGALLGFAAKNRRFSICKYLFGKHPTVAKSIGWAMLFVMALIPTLALSGLMTIGGTSFFWGGCFVCSFIIGFFMTSCLMMDAPQES